MIVRGHIIGIIAAAVTLALLSSKTADAGFVASASLEAFSTPASTGGSARPEGKADYEPPAWLKQLLTLSTRDGEHLPSGTTTGTSSTGTSLSPVAALGTPLLPPSCDPGQQLALENSPAHQPPDLGNLSPPPRG